MDDIAKKIYDQSVKDSARRIINKVASARQSPPPTLNETVSYGTETEEIGVVYAQNPETPKEMPKEKTKETKENKEETKEIVYSQITREAVKALNAQEDGDIPDKSSTINAVH